jgi:L-ascorbate metabolism protein UlaG (beta-lactamase superfamily)
VGWFTAPRAWRQATGWDRIPARERPVAVVPAALDSDSPEIRWLGHSGFRIVWGGTTVLLDPNTSRWCTVSRRVLEPVTVTGPADAVLISHAHFDHLDLPTLRGLSRVGVVVLPAGSQDAVDVQGIASTVLPIRAGERTTVGDLEIVAVPAAHNSSRLHPFRGRAAGLGYVIRRGTRTVYYAGDTGFANDFDAIRREHHPDIAILPIGAFAPRIPMRYYHLSPEEAVAAARILDADLVIPCHFGTFALSLDRPDQALPRFARAAAAASLRWEMPRLLTSEGGT